MLRSAIFAAFFAALSWAQTSLTYLDLGPSIRPCCIARDAAGNIYVAAAIRRPGPPASLTTVVAKVDRDLKPLYKFVFAPPGGNFPTSIAVDGQGNVFVAGWSDAPGFPLVSPLVSDWHAPLAGFVSKLDPSGSQLLFSTYLGRYVTALAVDAAGSIYVTGYAPPNEIPATPNGYRAPNPANPLSTSAFVAKATNNGDRLVYVAVLGPAIPNGIALSPDGSATIAGSTSDASYPTTPGAFQRTCGCAGRRLVSNGVVSRVSADGSALVWSTFIGGTGSGPLSDQIQFVAPAPDGGAIVSGTAASADFPTTPGAFQAVHGSGHSDFVVIRINSSGSGLIYSSRFGSSRDQ